MREVSLEELLEAGCHFGHQVTRQNPKARDYVFEARDNIHIIDLAKTKEGLEQAAQFVKELAKKNGSMIVVGTKRQAQGIVLEEIKRAQEEDPEPARNASNSDADGGIYTITNRWIGGILTNLSEVSKNFKKLKDYSLRLKSDEEKSKYTKKEIGQWEKERQKLEGLYGGIMNIHRVPDALFIIDTHLEDLAVREAARTGIKTVGIVDTNADPHVIDYPIPANDDAVGSIQLITRYIIDAWIEGRKAAKVAVEEPAPAQEAKASKSKKENTEKDSDKPKEEKPKTSKTKKTKSTKTEENK